jgi:hypothetical protein
MMLLLLCRQSGRIEKKRKKLFIQAEQEQNQENRTICHLVTGDSTEASVNGVSRDFFQYVNRDHSFFTVHETEKTVRRNYISQFVKNKYITITIRKFPFITEKT